VLEELGETAFEDAHTAFEEQQEDGRTEGQRLEEQHNQQLHRALGTDR